MILRQFCARHGRSAVPVSKQVSWRSFASERSNPWGPTNISMADSNEHAADLETLFNESVEQTSALENELQAHESSRILSESDKAPSDTPTSSATLSPELSMSKRQLKRLGSPFPPPPVPSLKKLYKRKQIAAQDEHLGSENKTLYDPKTFVSRPPYPAQVTLPMLMAAQSHLGHSTSLWNPRNSGYIFGIREGIHIIGLDVTAAYLRRAAKIVTEVARRGGMILFVGTRDGQEEIVVNAARRAGGYHIFDRWVPGTLTNGQQILGHCQLKVVDVHDCELPQYNERLRGAGNYPVLKPDLVICLNPLENEVCLHECGLHNVPTIGIIDTDADPSWVTYPIPANDDSLRCITLLAGVLGNAGKEGQRSRQEQAMRNLTTYSTTKVQEYLRGIEQLEEAEAESSPSVGASQPSAGTKDEV